MPIFIDAYILPSVGTIKNNLFSECNSPKKSPEVPKKISVAHINKVLSDVYGSGTAASQQETIPLQQKLVMCSLLLMLKQGKMKEVTVGKVIYLLGNMRDAK